MIIVLVLLYTFLSVYGQTKHVIVTGEQNSKWLDSLKTLKPDQQLLTINQRLLEDTGILVRQFYNAELSWMNKLITDLMATENRR